MKHSELILGDETGWFMNGMRRWVGEWISYDTILYRLADTRSKIINQEMFKGYKGIVVSDLYGAWTHIGKAWQVPLHCFRNPEQTIDDNKSAEFAAYYDAV